MTNIPYPQPEVLHTIYKVLTTFKGDAIKLREISESVQREDITRDWLGSRGIKGVW